MSWNLTKKVLKKLVEKLRFSFWDSMQRKLKCCGKIGPDDWDYHEDFSVGDVPDSCCKSEEKCGTRYNPSEIHTQGCQDVLRQFVKRMLLVIGVLCCAMAFVHFLGVILGCSLGSTFKEAS